MTMKSHQQVINEVITELKNISNILTLEQLEEELEFQLAKLSNIDHIFDARADYEERVLDMTKDLTDGCEEIHIDLHIPTLTDEQVNELRCNIQMCCEEIDTDQCERDQFESWLLDNLTAEHVDGEDNDEFWAIYSNPDMAVHMEFITPQECIWLKEFKRDRDTDEQPEYEPEQWEKDEITDLADKANW